MAHQPRTLLDLATEALVTDVVRKIRGVVVTTIQRRDNVPAGRRLADSQQYYMGRYTNQEYTGTTRLK